MNRFDDMTDEDLLKCILSSDTEEGNETLAELARRHSQNWKKILEKDLFQ